MPQPEDRGRSPEYLKTCLDNLDKELVALADKRWTVQEELWDAELEKSIENAPKAKGSIILWFGGKGQMLAKLRPILGAWAHKRYVEPFGGGASVLLDKSPVDVEVYNDLNEGLVTLFRVIADPEKFGRFHRRVIFLPYSRALYNEYRETWQDTEDEIDRAVRWFVVARMSFAGYFGSSFGTATTTTFRGMAGTSSCWLTCLSRLPAFHKRLARVQVEQQDWRIILDRYDSLETLFYLDPPYPSDTRKVGEYIHELTAEDHADIAKMLLGIKGQAVISSYPGDHYDALEVSGWQRKEWHTSTNTAAKTRATGIKGAGATMEHQPRTEVIWMSPKVARAAFPNQMLPFES